MRNIIKIISFGAGILIVLTLASALWGGGFWYTKGMVAERDARLAGIENETPGQIDVLCLGNSLGICGVDPMEMYKNYGYTAYNIGCEMQMPVETYCTIRTALKNQPVKVILWEANNISKHHKNLDAYISRLAEEYRHRFQILRYHYFWRNMIDDYRQRPYFKGFSINEYVDIAKYYSTPKSAAYVNGILDAVVKRLKREKLIIKD